MIVPRRQASSISNNVSPGTQPSATAFSQVLPPLRCPTITLKPLSRKLSDCPGPCTPYPITAIVSFFNTSRAFSKGNSSRVTTFSITPPKFICAIFFSIFRYYFIYLQISLSNGKEPLHRSFLLQYGIHLPKPHRRRTKACLRNTLRQHTPSQSGGCVSPGKARSETSPECAQCSECCSHVR